MFVVPADGGFPGGPRLRGDVVGRIVESGSVVGQHQVEGGDVNARLIPVDERDPIGGDADVARVGIAVDDGSLLADNPRPGGSATSNALWRHRAELIRVPLSACRRSVDERQPGRCGQPAVNRWSWRSVSATRRQSVAVVGGPPST